MDQVEIVRQLLNRVGLPEKQQSSLCCLTLLALAGIRQNDAFQQASNQWLRIHDLIVFISESYGISYAENSRETVRKQAIHHFRIAAMIEDNGKATNSPNYRYRLTPEFLEVVQSWSVADANNNKAIERFLSNHQTLKDIYASKKQMQMMPVKINSQDFVFSPGKHNLLQKAILEDFAPRYAPGAECLYVGDTTDKDLVKNIARLNELGFDITLHDKMPDIVLYREDKDWLYFIEAVTSVGPMDQKRLLELAEITKNVQAGKIFVTAFLDFKTFKKFVDALAWDTEIWVAEMPDHMIHLNGDRFIGPR